MNIPHIAYEFYEGDMGEQDLNQPFLAATGNGSATGGVRAPLQAAQGLDHHLSLIEITRTNADRYAHLLVGRDEVHKAGTQSVEDIVRCRLGGPGYDRTCFAVQDPDGRLHSAIYVFHMFAGHHDDPRNYHGNVRTILGSETRETNGAGATANIFYSISRLGDLKGAGEILVRKLHGYETSLHPERANSTLSPAGRQGFEEFLANTGALWKAMSDEAKIYTFLGFLLTKQDGVQKFHMGNGAIIGDIKLEADSVGPYRNMVNYVYNPDSDVLATNRINFRNSGTTGDLIALMAPHLQNLLKERRSFTPGFEPSGL